ncbi:RTA1-domain-containing protein [Periconia macrospinosa]|uniref:RTA1-domain-containing protein n=1 Tax=Periconia macrospinosa TaxID=97972 RepID=A0A2V1DQP4_9PLEO|nr:RTA1-domain-containing protein [Periconia macrospinosa]
MADNYRPSLDDPNVWVPYRYKPSKAAAIAFLALFTLTTLLHTYQIYKRRTWYFIPFVVGGVFEILGFVGRILSTNDIWALSPFIMQSLLLLIAPALFAASIYIILGRIILLTRGEKHSVIRQKWLTKFFVIGDVLSFVVQGGGGGIQSAGSLELLHAGEKIIVAGLFIQLAFFGFFIVVAGLFHWRLVRANPSPSTKGFRSPNPQTGPEPSPRRLSQSSASPNFLNEFNIHDLPWKRHIYALYVASALIMMRSVFRVVEYLQGNNGYLLRHEVYLYIFDGALMAAVMILFNWIHPAEITDLYQKRLTQEREWPLQERYGVVP